MALVCQECGYEQYDIDTEEEFEELFPETESRDIPYFCFMCRENATEEEREAMIKAMKGRTPA